ncbi:hypothetical protein BJY01DRAFT_230524 [Aspergillus pseudoustus]|uniref:Uncharacterized protein n=1 Tax=Aspergillus pseudoustus TaxID=1810923 RepID=A0ABR4I8Z5_9EURO
MIRSAKPKLSVSIASAQSTVSRPSLSLNLNNLKSPALASPRSPLPPVSPAASKRFSTLQIPSSTAQPSYNYVNSCSSKSILKKHAGATAADNKKSKSIQFSGNPTVHCITPIENGDEYYGSYRKLSKEERRWIVRE